MSYKKGLSKTRFKHKMRMFWTERWKYERTVGQWVESLTGPQVFWSTPGGGGNISTPSYSNPPHGRKAKDLLEDALDKLVLEKRLKKDEGENMKKMISGTEEDAYVAISVMATLKPKKFKKITTKNTETNE